jgi:hypothetical protein
LSHTKWTIPSNIIWSAHEDTISSRLEALQIFFSTTWEGRKAKAKGKQPVNPQVEWVLKMFPVKSLSDLKISNHVGSSMGIRSRGQKAMAETPCTF